MVQTLTLRADAADDIERAAQILRDGGTVAFPTETVYGLGANALNGDAVARIFEAKQRPSWDPLIVHIAAVAQLSELTQLDNETHRRVDLLGKSFWPGPLTVLLPKLPIVPDAVTAGRPLVGLRVPSHPVARALLQLVRMPVAAPSANTFGHTSPTTAQHVLDDLDGRIDAVLNGGATTVGLESTVIDPTQTPIVLYRPGAVTAAQIAEITEVEVRVFEARGQLTTEKPDALPSPGVGIRHYAPRAKVRLLEGAGAELRQRVASIVTGGILLPDGWQATSSVVVERWGNWSNPGELAANLFRGLRALDDKRVETIVCPLPEPGGLNDAIRDRLQKAARAE